MHMHAPCHSWYEQAACYTHLNSMPFLELISESRLVSASAQHAMLPDAHNRIVPNRLFTGLAYPEKLESYMHRTVAPGGPTLAQDLRGTWSVHYDPFKQIATCRSGPALPSCLLMP